MKKQEKSPIEIVQKERQDVLFHYFVIRILFHLKETVMLDIQT